MHATAHRQACPSGSASARRELLVAVRHLSNGVAREALRGHLDALLDEDLVRVGSRGRLGLGPGLTPP
jgi:hypothetical protein